MDAYMVYPVALAPYIKATDILTPRIATLEPPLSLLSTKVVVLWHSCLPKRAYRLRLHLRQF